MATDMDLSLTEENCQYDKRIFETHVRAFVVSRHETYYYFLRGMSYTKEVT
jgi:hypothetical protein